jgi:hypothetical protein
MGMENKEVIKFYSLEPILSYNAQYNVVFGERSNGKTYSGLTYMLKRYIAHGEEGAYIRRYKEDFRGKRGEQLFAALVADGSVKTITKGAYDSVKYFSGKWYLGNYNPNLDKIVASDKPFCYAFALSDMEHDKSTSYPDITTIIFDEFISREGYIGNEKEFITFMNVISTIVRYRSNVKIFMFGNTVNKYCPYFEEMGLKHIRDMKAGTIDVYKYGESGLKVAVEYCGTLNKRKPSDVYFAFNNPNLQMITGGVWELGLYPHLPMKYKQSDIQFTYFIEFDGELLQCEIIEKDDVCFTYIHRKSTPLYDPNNDIIFTRDYNPRPNYIRNIRKPTRPFEKRIASFFRTDKVFYQSNEIGEIVRNYLLSCLKET